MIKAGIIGIGHLGSIHLKLLNESIHFNVIGCFDNNFESKNKLPEEIPFFEDLNELVKKCDAVFICSITPSHFEIAKNCLEKNKHVFIEKPITTSVDEAELLVKLSKKKKLIGQVGHVERFNPAISSVIKTIDDPKFIECHRLAEFNPRGNDVSVVLDLMIHDIDVILKAVGSPVKNISASGVAVVSDTPDIANARLEFENGCVANLTTSRIAVKNMRKSRFFQKDAYISVDFLEKKAEIVRMKDATGDEGPFSMVLDLGESKGKKEIIFENPKVEPINAIREELYTFSKAIEDNTAPIVTINDGYNALKVAQEILDKIQSNIAQIG